ncbi:hypothetical protein [Aquimarina sp. MAR_2010_214]|uniref:hypothetical protein n=1 Tax=Aquimarina sp. MAR_2010_214 TaxID=1250026 RepID=UPI000C70ED7C|nr:hypothetical protein [Aquimarina sp. MAR_2010_214]
MKKFSIWYTLIFALLLGFISCETEDFNNDPEVEIVIDNKEGSAVYSFEAKTNGINNDAEIIWSVDGNDIEGEDKENIINQIMDYLFEPGKHTICVRIITEERTVEACADIEVEVDENNPCPDLFFRSKHYQGRSTYKFIADFKEIQEVSYGWYINGELVEDSAPNENNYFIWNFKEPGRYEVCIKTETPNCPEGVSYCKVIEVEASDLACPEVSFTKEMEPETMGTYTFDAKIEGVDEVSQILWFVDGKVVDSPKNDNDSQIGNRTLIYQFDSGVHEVCLKVITPDCQEGVKYCKEIRVGDCPDLFFEPERDGDKAAYYFYPRAFEGIDNITLEWFVNKKYVGKSPEFPHNNPFYHEFDGPGRYEVCLMIETPECPNGTSFCKIIEFE